MLSSGSGHSKICTLSTTSVHLNTNLSCGQRITRSYFHISLSLCTRPYSLNVSLAIPYSCGQIYHEVKTFIHFSDTFFRNPSALPIFMSSLLESSANPRFAIGSLHLDVQICECGDYNEWNKAIGNLLTYLPAIQHLHINLDLDCNDDLLLICSAIMPTTWGFPGSFTGQMFCRRTKQW